MDSTVLYHKKDANARAPHFGTELSAQCRYGDAQPDAVFSKPLRRGTTVLQRHSGSFQPTSFSMATIGSGHGTRSNGSLSSPSGTGHYEGK